MTSERPQPPDPTARQLNAGATDLKRRALSGFVWLSMGNASRAILKIAVIAVLARLLTPEHFGLVAAAGIVVWFSMIFSTLGVGPALVQRAEMRPVDASTAFIASVVLGVGFGVLTFGLAPAIASFFRLPELVPVLRAMALVFPLAALGSVSESLLQRELRFRMIAGAELASYAVGYGAVGIAMAWQGYGVWALVAAELTKTAIKSAFFVYARPLERPLSFDTRVLRDLLRFGSGYTTSGISIYFATQGDSFIVARFLGAGALGVYGRAYELMMVPAQALGVLLDKILFPLASRVQNDPARLILAYRRSTALVALTVLPCAAATLVLAPELVQVLLGPGWHEVVLPLQILSFAMYFRVAYMIGHSVAHAAGAVGGSAWRSAAHAVVVVAAALIGQRYGVAGVATGVVLAIALNFALVLHLGVRTTGIRWTQVGGLHARALALAALLGAECWLLATWLRAADAPAAVVLSISAAVVGATLLALVRLVPATLGADGNWIVAVLGDHLPRRMQPLLRKQSAP